MKHMEYGLCALCELYFHKYSTYSQAHTEHRSVSVANATCSPLLPPKSRGNTIVCSSLRCNKGQKLILLQTLQRAT